MPRNLRAARETLSSMRLFLPVSMKKRRTKGRRRGILKRKAAKKSKMSVKRETGREALGKRERIIIPPSRGGTGRRLKNARSRFASGQKPKAKAARLKSGPAEKTTAALSPVGGSERVSIQP